MSIRFPTGDRLASLVDELTVNTPRRIDQVICTGHRDLDHVLNGGLRIGQVTLVGGVAGVGTTTFALGLARNASFRHNLRTVVIAPDSSERELLIRIIAAESRVPVGQLREARLDVDDLRKLDRHRDALRASPLMINAQWTTAPDTEAILDSARVCTSDGTQFVVIDGTSAAEPRARELIKGLRSLALEHKAAVVVTSKAIVPRDHENRPPALVDLREYEQIADLVDLAIILHRDDLHDARSTRPGEAELGVVKHRYGPQREISLYFQGHYARVVDVPK